MARPRTRFDTEAQIQRKILRYLHTVCWSVKVISSNHRGVPDIICCYKGLFVAFEVKNHKGKVSTIQRAQMLAINDSDGCPFVVRSVDDVKSCLIWVAQNKVAVSMYQGKVGVT
jgi:hypothetical protein